MLLSPEFLSIIFATLMGFSILVYVILDGYDLGIGMLMFNANPKEKNLMISSIGPFWDANETWLVLSIGLLLVAFPIAHGVILTSLYLPTAVMLIGLILRGVSFDFRAKAKDSHKNLWDRLFMVGSLIVSVTQGYMLGLYIMGFEKNVKTILFSLLIGIALAAGYCFIGSCWLIIKTENELQKKSVKSAQIFLWFVAIGIILVSIATPLVSKRIFYEWFSFPEIVFLSPIPIFTALLILFLNSFLKRMPIDGDRYHFVPFLCGVLLFIFCFVGLAYSFFPYIIPGKMTIYEASSDSESLIVILIGTIITLPAIVFYTIFVHRIFWGKTNELTY